MPNTKQILLLLISLGLFINTIFAINIDTLQCIDKVYSKNINSVRIHQTGWEESYPVINLYSDNPLIFSFDQLDSEPIDFYYTIIHCTYDWKPSDLLFFEYAEGFDENDIRDYEESHSTFVPYTHFSLKLPNRDVKPIISGNYLLIVYTKEEQVDIICTKRFMVYENEIDATGRINLAIESDYRKKYQKLDFKLDIKNYYVGNPHDDIKIVILQNYQWINSIKDISPNFLDNESLVYEWDNKTRFDAANEYRYFSFNNLEILSEFVQDIEFKNPYYYIKLFQDKPKFFSSYSSYDDINGHYVVSTKRFANNDFPEVEAEYAIVSFALDYNPIPDADIYIFGELTGYEISDKYKMKYNLETHAYENLLFLKQAYYNYKYILVYDDIETKPDLSYFEGSYQETENDYLLLVYHRNPSESYDKLINFTIFNSRNNK